MNDDSLRAMKVDALRDAAEGFRQIAATGVDVQTNLVFADLLEKRATRIANGEADHSAVIAADGDAEDDGEGGPESVGDEPPAAP